MSDRQETDREILIPGLIAKLENMLSLLDDNGHAVAAIKVEEAIFALKQEARHETQRQAPTAAILNPGPKQP